MLLRVVSAVWAIAAATISVVVYLSYGERGEFQEMCNDRWLRPAVVVAIVFGVATVAVALRARHDSLKSENKLMFLTAAATTFAFMAFVIADLCVYSKG